MTGSPWVGTLGEAAFFGFLFLLGLICLANIVTTQILHPTPHVYQTGFGFWLMILVLASFVIIGGAGVIYTALQVGASVERRAALVRRAADIDLLRSAWPSPQEYPSVPRESPLTNSPGVQLAYRLPMQTASAWTLWLSACFCLLFTGVTVVLAVVAVNSFHHDRPEWFLAIVLIPLIVADAWLLSRFVRQLWQRSVLGHTCLEISRLPLRPGKQYEVFLSQAGRGKLASVEVSLTCTEEATYHQGTDIRTERRVVHKQEILKHGHAKLHPRQPLELRASFVMPDDAMHSFRSAHNAIHWQLVAEARLERGWKIQRCFSVVVYPPKPPSDD